MEKCQDLKREIGRLWKLKMAELVPVVIGALGIVTKEFDGWIEKLGITNNVGVMQKTALLGTARILRKVLEMLVALKIQKLRGCSYGGGLSCLTGLPRLGGLIFIPCSYENFPSRSTGLEFQC